LIPLRWSLCRFRMNNHMKQQLLSVITCLLSFILSVTSLCGAEAGNVELHGRIVDIMAQPVAGAEVYLYDSKQVKRPVDFISQKTKSDGIYRLTVPAGVYWAVAILRQTGPSFGPLQVGDKHSGEPLVLDLKNKKIEEVDFTIMDLRDAVRHSRKRSEELFEIQGRILDAHEKPLAMAYVLADNRSMPGTEIPRFLSAWTGIDGQYTLYLPAGAFYLGTSTIMPPSPEEKLSHFIEVAGDMQGLDLVLRGPHE
jgi:hypothetical protein